MAKSNAQPQGDFATMQDTPSKAVNASGAPSAHTTVVTEKGSGSGGAIAAATATHRVGILERNGAALHIHPAMYKPEAQESAQTWRHVKIMPSALGNRDFWAARGAAQV